MPFDQYSPKQKKIARVAAPRNKITEADFKELRRSKDQEKSNSQKKARTRMQGNRREREGTQRTRKE